VKRAVREATSQISSGTQLHPFGEGDHIRFWHTLAAIKQA